MEIVPLGDAAFIVRAAEDFERHPEHALEAVLRVRDQLRSANINGITDIAPAYTTVAVFFDSAAIENADALIERVKAALARPSRSSVAHARTIEVPVCYDAEFAPDLAEVATHARISPTDVVRLHSRSRYIVSHVGFLPGFPYLSGLPQELATPRRASPRTRVPAGSVAIGGIQTGIYPHESPGGWNIIGRTPLRLFTASKTPPSLLQPGDRVRFRPISREEFLAHGE